MGRAGKVGLAALLAASALAAVPAAAARPAAAGRRAAPASFDLLATAVGTLVQVTQQPAPSVVTAGLIDASAGVTISTLASYGVSASRAAAAYPGDLVAGGPALFCASVLPCPAAPPSYPMLADASYPSRPRAATPVTPVASAVARAGQHWTDAAAAAANAASGGPASVTAGTVLSSTRAWVDDAGAHVTGRSSLHQISVGPLQVAALDATEAVTVSPSGALTDRPRLTLSGVTFAGTPASVDDTGVHVAGHEARWPARVLAAQGVTVRLLGTSRLDRPGAARSAAAGLLVTLSAPVRGVPPTVPGLPSANRTYLGSVLLGGAGAAVAAGDVPALALARLPAPAAGSAADHLLPPGAGTGASHLAAGGSPATGGAGSSLAARAVRPAAAPAAAASWWPLADLQSAALVLLVLPLALLLSWRGLGRLTGAVR